MKRTITHLLAGAALLAPSFVLAASSVPGGINTKAIQPYTLGIADVINNILVPTLIAIAFIVFLWGVFKYFILDNDKAKKEGKDLALWGIIGFVVIFALWGLVYLVMSVFGLSDNTAAPKPPTFGGSGSKQETKSNTTLPTSGDANNSNEPGGIDQVLCDTVGIYCPPKTSGAECPPSQILDVRSGTCVETP